MKIISVIAAATLATVSMPVASFANEAAAPCSCVTAGPSVGQVGNIVSAKGEVLTNGAKDFVAANKGMPISIGSEISVGAGSAAQISVGTCGLSLAPSSVTRVSAQEGGNICVSSIQTMTSSYGADAIEEIPQAPSAPAAPVAAGFPAWVPFAVAGGIAATVGIVVLANDDDDKKSVSP